MRLKGGLIREVYVHFDVISTIKARLTLALYYHRVLWAMLKEQKSINQATVYTHFVWNQGVPHG